MQYVVSVKAGLVNHVHGATNVAEMEQVLRGGSITTSRGGYAEVLLTPGSFLRIGENSAVVLDGVDLESVSLRVVKGPALIEVIEINRKFPIRVTTGDLTMNIVKAGLYRFDNGVATVLDGRLQTLDTKLAYEKGWQVFIKDTYRARKTLEVPHDGLDEYSQTRSEIIAQANMALAASTRGPIPDSPFWIYSTAQGFYTYLPDGNHRSPYGYQYYRAGYVAVRPSPPGYSSGSTSSSPSAPSAGNSGNSGGGGGGGGGGAPVTVSTPAGSPSTPAGYIGGKGGTTGATQ
jgi:hypothetical protein